jgi:hypothetical protein
VDNVMVNASVCVSIWICTAKRDGDLLEILGLKTYIPCTYNPTPQTALPIHQTAVPIGRVSFQRSEARGGMRQSF